MHLTKVAFNNFMSKTSSIKIYLPLQEAERYIYPSYQVEDETVVDNTKTLTEQKLIKLCLKKNRKAQKELYDKHGPTMKMVCLRYLYDKSSAEDALNKAFLKVFTKLKTYKNAGSFEGWIRKVVVNECLDINRQTKKTIRIDEDSNRHDFSTLPIAEQNHNTAYILRVVNQLPDGYRTVFNMVEIDGFSHKEVAQKLEITESASRSQLTKAKKILRKKLEVFKS